MAQFQQVLRLLAKEICIPLTDCINSAILNGKFPSELKMADVIAIFKKDDPFEKENYRLISLLPPRRPRETYLPTAKRIF